MALITIDLLFFRAIMKVSLENTLMCVFTDFFVLILFRTAANGLSSDKVTSIGAFSTFTKFCSRNLAAASHRSCLRGLSCFSLEFSPKFFYEFLWTPALCFPTSMRTTSYVHSTLNLIWWWRVSFWGNCFVGNERRASSTETWPDGQLDFCFRTLDLKNKMTVPLRIVASGIFQRKLHDLLIEAVGREPRSDLGRREWVCFRRGTAQESLLYWLAQLDRWLLDIQWI